MRICIPTVDDEGQRSRLSTHFGRAPLYTLVSEDGTLEVVTNPHAQHPEGRCDAAQDFGELGIGAVVCMGMGPNALAGLRRRRVAVFVTTAGTVQEAVEALSAGRVVAAELEASGQEPTS